MANESKKWWRGVVGAGELSPAAKRPVSRKSRTKAAIGAGVLGASLGVVGSEAVRQFGPKEEAKNPVAEAELQNAITEEDSKFFTIAKAAAEALGNKTDATANDVLKWLGAKERETLSVAPAVVARIKEATGDKTIDMSVVRRRLTEIEARRTAAEQAPRSVDFATYQTMFDATKDMWSTNLSLLHNAEHEYQPKAQQTQGLALRKQCCKALREIERVANANKNNTNFNNLGRQLTDKTHGESYLGSCAQWGL